MKLYYFDENDEEYKEYKEEESLCSKCSEFNKTCMGATDVTECKSFKMKTEKEKKDADYFRELWEKVEGNEDNVEHPNHYLGTESLECIDVMEFALGEDGFAYYCIGNIFKYLWRHDKKNGEEDLEKAKKYLQFLELRKPYLSGPVNELAERVTTLYESVI